MVKTVELLTSIIHGGSVDFFLFAEFKNRYFIWLEIKEKYFMDKKIDNSHFSTVCLIVNIRKLTFSILSFINHLNEDT